MASWPLLGRRVSRRSLFDPLKEGDSLKSLMLIFCFVMLASEAHASDTFASSKDFIDAKGQIILPLEKIDYRRNWSYLGSWLVPQAGDGQGFHEVFTQNEAVDYYRKNGKFADGTVLIKEIRDFKQSSLSTGPGVYHSGKNKIWFVMIKDGEKKHQGPNWGNGWGWALFKTGMEGNQSKNFSSDCLGCHVPAQKDDWIYVEGYPTLGKDPFKYVK